MVRPNPQLGVEVENFAGAGDLRGFQGADTTFSLSQEIERGGKRRARIALADRDLDLAQLDRLVRGLDLLRDVEVAYYEAAAAQELVSIARDRLATARATLQAVERRVAAARDPLMASARAQTSFAEAQAALDRSERDAESKRAILASYWRGAPDFSFPSQALLAVDEAVTPPDAANAPDVLRSHAMLARARATSTLERTQAYQNPTVSAGFRRFGETEDGAFVAGVSIPLGAFDRNRGAIARAEAESRQAQFEVAAAEQQYNRERARLVGAIASDVSAVNASERNIIPAAERALVLARDGYGRGAFSYLDIIDAEHALADAQEARVSALLTLATNRAALNRLSGRFADVASNESIQP